MAKGYVWKDEGWNNIKEQVLRLNRQEAQVGFFDKHADEAAYNEFGTEKAPARPFMRTTYERYGSELLARNGAAYRKFLARETKTFSLLRSSAIWYVGRVKSVIKDARAWAVANAPSTIEKKGSSFPLRDTDEMMNAVTYRLSRDEK